MDIASFVNLLKQLNSPDDSIRKPATAKFEELKKDAEGTMQRLVTAGNDFTQTPEVRQTAIVLLRHILSEEEFKNWNAAGPNTKDGIKQNLLNMVNNERDSATQNTLVNLVSDLACYLLPKGGWQELFPAMNNMTKSSEAFHRVAALYLFSEIALTLGCGPFQQMLGAVKQILSENLAFNGDSSVRVAALDATSSFIKSMNGEHEQAQFRDLLPGMLQTISACLNASDEDSARNALTSFVEIAEEAPLFFKPNLAELNNAMFMVASSNQLEEETREAAIEVLVTLTEAKPVMMKRSPGFVLNIVKLLLQCMSEKGLEDENEWLEFDEDDTTHLCDNAEASLDRVALALKGKTVIPALFQVIPPMFSSQNWCERYAAIMSLGLVSEGCNKMLKPHLQECLKNLFVFTNDREPRVRWAMCNCIGQLCTDFGPSIQKQYGEHIIQCLLKMMEDSVTRVRAHAASCLINFCEQCELDVLLPFVDPMVNGLGKLLASTQNVKVQEAVLTAISTIAESANKYFAKYYDTFVPFLKNIISSSVGDNASKFKMLKSKALECLTLIGGVVDPAKFRGDADFVMKNLIASHASSADDTEAYYLETSFSRIAESLGKDFLPYLDKVMPPTMERAEHDADVKVLNNEEAQEGWEVVPIGDISIGIHTSQIEEKLAACVAIMVYAEALKDDFLPYVEKVSQIAVKNLTFEFHEDVRSTSAAMLPVLLTCVQEAIKTGKLPNDQNSHASLSNLFNFIFDGFMKSMEEEEDASILDATVTSLQSCLRIMSGVALPDAKVDQLIGFLMKQFEDWVKRMEKRDNQKKEVADDEEEYEKRVEEDEIDDSLCTSCTDALGAIAKYQPAGLPKIFGKVIPSIMPLFGQGIHPSLQHKATCICDDLIENCGQQAQQLIPQVARPFIAECTSTNLPLAQAASFGLGILSQSGPSQFAPFAQEAVNALFQVINAPGSRNPDDDIRCCVTENAIASIGRIVKHNAGNLSNASEAITVFARSMPLTNEVEEGPNAHDLFLSMVQSNTPEVVALGPAHIIKAIASFITTAFSNSELDNKAKAVLGQLQSQLGAQVNTIFSSLPKESQEHIKKCMGM